MSLKMNMASVAARNRSAQGSPEKAATALERIGSVLGKTQRITVSAEGNGPLRIQKLEPDGRGIEVGLTVLPVDQPAFQRHPIANDFFDADEGVALDLLPGKQQPAATRAATSALPSAGGGRLRSAALMPLPANNASLGKPSFLSALSTRDTALSVVRWECSMIRFQPGEDWRWSKLHAG